MIGLLVLLVIGVVVLGPVAFAIAVNANRRIQRIEESVWSIQARLAEIESPPSQPTVPPIRRTGEQPRPPTRPLADTAQVAPAPLAAPPATVPDSAMETEPAAPAIPPEAVAREALPAGAAAPKQPAEVAAEEQPVAIVQPPSPIPATEEPATPGEPPPPPIAPTPPAAPPVWTAPAPASFEERFGTRWVVWVGGLALALGGIFLVQYSIQQGWLVPAVRVLLGGILAAGLLIAGEWARRSETLSNIAAVPAVHIPGVLTAAGTVVAFSTVYAAYALYGFLGPALAFALLGAVGLATLAAALLHGPALAGLGLASAYLSPALVATETPNYWALTIYLATVSAAALALASVRHWRWLAIASVILGVLWTFPGIGDAAAVPAHAFHLAAGLLLVAVFIVSGFLLGPDIAPGEIELESSGALAAYLVAAAALVFSTSDNPLALIAFALLIAATLAIAWRAEAATLAVPAAGLLALAVFLEWSSWPRAIADTIVPRLFDQAITPLTPVILAAKLRDSLPDLVHLVVGIALGTLFSVSGLRAQGRSSQVLVPIAWSASGALVPIALLIALYRAANGSERSVLFVVAALAIASLYSSATEGLIRRAPRRGSAAASAFYATAAVAALALAVTFGLEKGWLSVGLALIVPGIAWISNQRPLPALRYLAAVLVAIVLVRTAWEPRIVGDALGTTPIFNWALYGYGVPAGAFWLAGFLLRRRNDDGPTRATESGAIVLTVLLFFIEIRHLINGGEIYRPLAGLTELALQVSVGLALAIGLERLRTRTGSIVHDIAAFAVAGSAVMAAVIGLVLARNPLWTAIDLGGPILNFLLLAYLLPACLLAILDRATFASRPPAYHMTVAALAIAFVLFYLSLEVTRLYRGPVLTAIGAIDAEYYTYPILWLACSVALASLWRRTRSGVRDIAAMSLAGLAVTVIAGGLANRHDLWTNGNDVGGLFVNLMLLAYLAPAVLAAVIARSEARPERAWYRTSAAIAAVALGLLYLTIEVTRCYRGPILSAGVMSDAEQYTYSAVWLAFGVALLLAGIGLTSQPLRLASAAVVLITVGKVFLIDLSGLAGGFRALSFIVLGLVLVGIGWLYQRLLFPRRRTEPPPVA